MSYPLAYGGAGIGTSVGPRVEASAAEEVVLEAYAAGGEVTPGGATPGGPDGNGSAGRASSLRQLIGLVAEAHFADQAETMARWVGRLQPGTDANVRSCSTYSFA